MGTAHLLPAAGHISVQDRGLENLEQMHVCGTLHVHAVEKNNGAGDAEQ